MGPAESSTSANGKRKLWVACNACRFRKVKCDREPRLEQGFSTCTNCESSSMECVLTVNPPKKRMGKRMKMLQEQQDGIDTDHAQPPARCSTASTRTASAGISNGTSLPPSTSNLFDDTVAMSPGFSSLLEAVSQQEALNASSLGSSSIDPAVNSSSITAEVNGNTTAYVQDSLPDVGIIQNGMFAAFSSGSRDAYGPATETIAAFEPRRTSLDNVGATIHSLSSAPSSSTGVTPKSAGSDQSSPEVIYTNAAFLSRAITNGQAAQPNGLRQRNPFDKSPADTTSSGQIGFVGGLLGIASLDKNMLDVCTKSYFESTGQCIGFIRPEWYWPRYHAFFSRYAGMFQDVSSNSNEQPLSELLLIAVACRGAGTSQFANRFELQKDLYQHYCRLIKDRERLVRDGFDALESVILMVEHADGIPKPLADPMSVEGVFDIEVLSHEGLIRLMKKLELHKEKPFGTALEGRDGIRQRILFWTIFVFDAIRCESDRMLPLIHEEDISISRTLPNAVAIESRLLFRDYFVELAGICRRVSFRILSNRTRERGIDPKDVLEILDDLQAWHDKLTPLFAWDWNDMLHITGPADPEDQTRRTFLIFLFLGQWLILDYAVQEIGLSPTCDAEVKQTLLRRLDAEVDATLDRQVLVCDHGTLFGIIRLHPGMMQSWTITWAGWCLKKMEAIKAEEANGRLASAKADQAFQRYQSAVICFINATASCDSVQHTPTTVQDLMNTLRKVTDARKMSRLTFDQL